MIAVLVIALMVLVGLTVFSLLRGLNAFRQEIDASANPEAARELQLKQNKMMWARIRYQFLAIALVVLILLVSR